METFRREDDRISTNISVLNADIDERHEILSKMSFSGSDFMVFKNYLVHLDANRSSWLKQQEEVRKQIEQVGLNYRPSQRELKCSKPSKRRPRCIRKSRKHRAEGRLMKSP